MPIIAKTKEELVSEIKNLSPITSNDMDLYDAFFKKESLSNYANNFSYITQACRNLGMQGFKFVTDETLISLGYHNGHFVIVRPLGNKAIESVESIAAQLFDLSRLPVYLKHLSESQAISLSNNRKIIEMAQYPWEQECPLDDDTFPQAIINLQNMVGNAINKPENAKIRLRVNRFKNFFTEELQFVKYSPDVIPQQMDIAYGIVSRCAKDLTSYINMIKHPVNSNFNLLLYIGEKPIGFYVFGRIGNSELGCFANICDYMNYPALCEAALINAFNFLYESGIEKVNLGGSEIENLHRFKLKLNPSTLKNTSHKVYKP